MKTIAAEELDRAQGKVLVFGKSVKIGQKLEELKDGERAATLRTVIPFKLKSINEADRTIEFVGSTAAEDRYGDSITQAGWDVGNFTKNPVVPWGHDYSMPPVAKALEVGFKDGNLVFKAQFATADEYAWADTIYKLYLGGYLRAFSVGFIPTEFTGDWFEGYVFTKCELLEVSCVTVPANPEALVLAFDGGEFSPAERKSMIAKSQELIKALTENTTAPENEDMETANAIKELTQQLAELKDLVVGQQDAEVPDDAPVDDPEQAGDAEPAPGEVGEDAPTGTEDDVLKDVDPAEFKKVLGQVVGDAIAEKLDYQLGTIK